MRVGKQELEVLKVFWLDRQRRTAMPVVVDADVSARFQDLELHRNEGFRRQSWPRLEGLVDWHERVLGDQVKDKKGRMSRQLRW